MTKKGPVTMKFQSLSSDGIVTIDATPEQKHYLTDVLDHYYLQKLATPYGTPDYLSSYLDENTDVFRRSNWPVEDIISTIKEQELTRTLRLPSNIVEDLYQLLSKAHGCAHLRDEENRIEDTTKKLAQIVKKIDPEPEMKA